MASTWETQQSAKWELRFISTMEKGSPTPLVDADLVAKVVDAQ